MASKIIGRCDCPECGFNAAHVKESERCKFRYCPECGAQYHARTERQQKNLMANMRAVDQAPPPAPEPTPAPSKAPAPTPTPEPTPLPTPTPRRRGLF